MKKIITVLTLVLIAGLADLADLKVGTTYAAEGDALVADIETLGGHVVRDARGQHRRGVAGAHVGDRCRRRTSGGDQDGEAARPVAHLCVRPGAEAIGKAAQLEELNLFAAEFITDAAVAFLRGNTNLRVLNLRGTDVTDTSLEYVGKLTNLRSLDISFTQIADVGMEHLAPLSQLEELNLGGMKISGSALHVLKLLPKLKRLSFYGVQRRNAGMCWAPVVTDIELDTIALLTGLEELNIGDGVALGAPRPDELGPRAGEAECRIAGGTRITDFGVAKLAKLKKLRSLNLSGSVVTGGVLKTLAGLPNLQRLSLWNAEGINDSAAAGFESLQSVTSLDLSNTGIGDRTMTSLAKLPKLQRLYISDTAVTEGGVAAFKQQRAAASCPGGPGQHRRSRSWARRRRAGRNRMTMRSSRFRFLFLGAAVAVAVAALAAVIHLPVVEAQAPAPSFATTVYPVFEKAGCRACHTDEGVASGTRLHFPPRRRAQTKSTRSG